MPVRPVSQLIPRQVPWLWPGRLALGKLSLFEGDPGLGKSLVALDLCARLSTGRPFPDGCPGPGVGRAIIMNAEDSAEDTIQPRLQALGADLENIFILDSEDADANEPLRLPSQTRVLDEALAQTRAQLVVIDPVLAFLEPGINPNSDRSVRRALFPLARLADKHQCHIELVRHLNKSLTSHSMYRGGGSIGFIAACRSAWLFARDPQEPRRCVLAQVKNNLAPPQPSLVYEVLAQEAGPPTLSWAGTSPLTADQLLAGAAPGKLPGRPLTRACDFLEEFLKDGPRTSRDIWAAAQDLDLSERTLNRALEKLEGHIQRVWAEGARLSYWLLRNQQLPATAKPEDAPPDLEEWLAPLREQYPPPTPLDDP